MRPRVPPQLIERAGEWDELHRWERSELGKELRRLGLTYGEIRELIPVPKGTLSYWCREIDLTQDQIEAIRERAGSGSREGIPVDTQWRRREEIEQIRQEARRFAEAHGNEAALVVENEQRLQPLRPGDLLGRTDNRRPNRVTFSDEIGGHRAGSEQ